MTMGTKEIFLLLFLFVNGLIGSPLLLCANRKDVRIVDLNNSRGNSTVVVGNLNDAAAVDFLYEDRSVFFSDVSQNMIKRTWFNGSEITVNVITTGLISPDGLAVDWLGRKIYWTDSRTQRIEVANLDGSYRKVIYRNDVDQSRAIALDPLNGYMYWTDWGVTPKIERGGMDGNHAHRSVIIKENILWPNGLTLDYDYSQIYWTDVKHAFIHSCKFDGSDRRVVVEGVLPLPFALALYDQTLYWTYWNDRSIHSCDKINGSNRRVILGDIYSPMDIHSFSARRQPKDTNENACDQHNGGCSHLCLMSPAHPFYTCACPTGIKLKLDNKTCNEGYEQLLLIANGPDLRMISLDTPDYTDVVLELTNVQQALAIDFDPVDNQVYWTDSVGNAIWRANIDGTGQEKVTDNLMLKSYGIAVDWIGRNLYWTNEGAVRIEVSRLNGISRRVLIAQDLEKLGAITLDPISGYMYWTDWGTKPKIERANMDGSGRVTLVNTSLIWPNGIAVDHAEMKIYWGDAKLDTIEVANYDGTGRRVLVNLNRSHLFGISLLGDYIYWSGWHRPSIERVNKRSGIDRKTIVDRLPHLRGLKAVNLVKIEGSGGWRTVYTTPGSYLQINASDSEIVTKCKFLSTDTNLESDVVDTFDSYGKYNTIKYQINTSKITTITIQAPQQLGHFSLEIKEDQTRKLNEKDLQLKTDDRIHRMEGSTIDLTFTYNVSLRSNNYENHFMDNCYEFQLRITNASKNDIGNYTCSVYVPIYIKIATIRFLDQYDHNIIYGQEGKTMNISCAAITGYDVKKIKIEANLNILAESESNIVTFSLKPSRQHHSKEYLCSSEPTYQYVLVRLLVNYAPDVKVLFEVNRIDCVPDGFPDTYTFDRWEHQSEQGEHIRFLNGLENGTLILQTLPQQYQISGRYVCTVSNGIPDINDSMLQTNFISYNYQGPPIFVRENRNVKFVELYKPTTITFLLYSNPVVEEIWIEGVAPCYTKNETILNFRISETELLYSDFGNKGNIKGNEIAFEFKMFSIEYEMYKIWTKNRLGEDSFDFNIQAVESGKKIKKDRTGLISSSSIAAGLLVYIIVLHIYLFVRHRMKRTRRGHIQEPLHYYTYEEIGLISYEAVNTRRLDINQQGPILPPRIISSPQNESTTTTIDNRPAMNVSTSSRVSLQESQLIAARRSYNAETAIDTSSPLPIEEIRHSDGCYNEDSVASTDDSLQSFQRRSHQDEHSSNSNRASTCSSISDESRIEANGTTSMGLNAGDEYENPYQIVIHENQGTHQYSSIINSNAGVDSARSTFDTDEQTPNVTDYVNLRL